MENFELAVNIIVNDYEKTINEDYQDWGIESWNDMLQAFGQDSQEIKEDVIYTLHNEHKLISWCDEDAKEFIVNGTNETINYRKLMNSVRKEMKNRGLLA